MNKFVSRLAHTVLLALTLSASVGQAAQGPTVHANAAQYQQWIEAMKDAERGPFLVYFCIFRNQRLNQRFHHVEPDKEADDTDNKEC